jgi:hypothetical protein
VGGFGSGRHGAPPTAEATAAFVLAIKTLAPLFRQGQCLTGSLGFDDGRFPVMVTVDLTDAWNCFVELIHQTRDLREGDRIVTRRVELAWTVPTYGGRRWWFLCPRTGRKVTKLFLPNGGWHFWSRQAYGLGYACQRDDRFGRLQRRAAMLNRTLGGEGWATWSDPPPKPKWMRWRTYDRKYECWERAVEKADEEFTIRAARLLKWM